MSVMSDTLTTYLIVKVMLNLHGVDLVDFTN